MNQAGRSDEMRDITEPGWREREEDRHKTLKSALPTHTHGGQSSPGIVVKLQNEIKRLQQRIAELEQRGEPVAWIEHHKAGDNLNWERVDHSYAKATPMYLAAPSPEEK